MARNKDFKVIHANAVADMAETIGVPADLADEVRARAQSVYNISLEDNTVNAMKRNFDEMMNDMISEMLAHGNGEGEITVKVAVELTSSSVDKDGHQLREPVIKPMFTHKVTTLCKRKLDVNGQVGGDYALVLDPKTNKYVMRKITSVQTDLFDSEDEEE